MHSQVLCLVALATLMLVGCNESATTKSVTVGGKVQTPDRTPRIFATASWDSAPVVARTGIIRNADDAAHFHFMVPFDKTPDLSAQKEATAILAKRFKVDTIDWSKQMIVFADAGKKKARGFSVEITSLAVKGNEMIVKWRVTEPKPDESVTRENIFPSEAALIERFDGLITFDPAVMK